MDNSELIEDLLRTHGLKKTAIRINMLELFMQFDFALSATNIIAKMKAKHDRVTVYRALNSFEEHGILHRASEDGHGTRYALCKNDCPNEHHADQHAHFVCNECQHTYCLEEVTVPKVPVSDGFLINKISYELSGVCNKCMV